MKALTQGDMPRRTARQHYIESVRQNERGRFWTVMQQPEFAAHRSIVVTMYERVGEGSDPCIFTSVKKWDEGLDVKDLVIIWKNEKRISIIEGKYRPTQRDMVRAWMNVYGMESIWSDPRPGRQYIEEMNPLVDSLPPEPDYVYTEDELASASAKRARVSAEMRKDSDRRERAEKVLTELHELENYMLIGKSLRSDGGMEEFLVASQLLHIKLFKGIDKEVTREIGSMLPRVPAAYVELSFMRHRSQMINTCEEGYVPRFVLQQLRDDLAKLLPSN